MKFKVGLVAGVISLATLFSTGASAATLSAGGGAVTYSQQGLATAAAGATVTLPAVVANLSSEYLVNDQIAITITGVTLAAGLNPTLSCTHGAYTGAGDAALTIGFLSQSGNTLNFRVTNRTGGAGTVSTGLICTSSAINTTDAALAAVSGVSATWTATAALSGTPIDLLCATADGTPAVGNLGVAGACGAGAQAAGPANTVTLASVKAQFAEAVVTPFSGVVDVNTAYESFANAPTTSDTLSITLTNNNYNLAVIASDVALDVTGNFSEILGTTATSGKCTGVSVAGFLSATYFGTPTISGNCAAATVTAARGAPPAVGLAAQAASLTVLEPAPSTTTLPLTAPQTFTGDVTWTYTGTSGTAGLTQIDSIAPGAWTLNGFQARVGYMPYSPTISRVVWISNKSSLAGVATMTARNTAGVACPATGSASLGAVAAHAVTALAAAVDAALATCYGAGFTDKVDFTITATIPQTSGYLFSAYTVDGTSRQIIVNSSNVQP